MKIKTSKLPGIDPNQVKPSDPQMVREDGKVMKSKTVERLMNDMPQHVKDKVDRMTENIKKVYALAENSWEGCDGCTEDDKYFYMKGFQAGYNSNDTPELSDEEILKEAIEHSNLYTNKFTPRNAFIMGAKWYREQLKK